MLSISHILRDIAIRKSDDESLGMMDGKYMLVVHPKMKPSTTQPLPPNGEPFIGCITMAKLLSSTFITMLLLILLILMSLPSSDPFIPTKIISVFKAFLRTSCNVVIRSMGSPGATTGAGVSTGTGAAPSSL
ncbi:hypothetical protein G4B88_020212 [Cannabis sativa]|uniref:Uncharacterized protein n=1 Tax=Cannabis sativa TaxID=3483 RepID=A0A7J6GTW2_CANSA|nr:hypothetical protein G4B88_020212 [Cannabis sativa]